MWNEAGVYGPTTTQAILNASHMKRGIQVYEDNYISQMQLLIDEMTSESAELVQTTRNDVEKCRGIHQELQSLPLKNNGIFHPTSTRECKCKVCVKV